MKPTKSIQSYYYKLLGKIWVWVCMIYHEWYIQYMQYKVCTNTYFLRIATVFSPKCHPGTSLGNGLTPGRHPLLAPGFDTRATWKAVDDGRCLTRLSMESMWHHDATGEIYTGNENERSNYIYCIIKYHLFQASWSHPCPLFLTWVD